MGGTVPGIGLFVWSLFGSLPHWTVGLILVGALLFSGYFTWRDEYLARVESSLRLRARVKSMTVYDLLKKVEVLVTILNSGPATIVEDWTLTLPSGLCVPAIELDFDHFPLTARERPEFENVVRIAQAPLESGARKELAMQFDTPTLSPQELREMSGDGSIWILSHKDAAGAEHRAVFKKREGKAVEMIKETDLTPHRRLV